LASPWVCWGTTHTVEATESRSHERSEDQKGRWVRSGRGLLGTCSKLEYKSGKNGFCLGLKVPVKTYGCCNYWVLAPDDHVRAASGQRLKVVR
jgi:hypothetical protein